MKYTFVPCASCTAKPQHSDPPLKPAKLPAHFSRSHSKKCSSGGKAVLRGVWEEEMEKFLYLLLLLLPTPRRHTPLRLCLLLLSQQPL